MQRSCKGHLQRCQADANLTRAVTGINDAVSLIANTINNGQMIGNRFLAPRQNLWVSVRANSNDDRVALCLQLTLPPQISASPLTCAAFIGIFSTCFPLPSQDLTSLIHKPPFAPKGYKFRLHPEGHKIRQAAQLSFIHSGDTDENMLPSCKTCPRLMLRA